VLHFQEFAARWASQTSENAGVTTQILRNKRVIGSASGFWPGFAGFLPAQSATDCTWIGPDRGQGSGFSCQRPGVRCQVSAVRNNRPIPVKMIRFSDECFHYDERREITGKVVGRIF
jgi:hypothetical protein